jgi:uncharacterized protein
VTTVDVVRAAQRQAAPWPYAQLDVKRAGVPFREVVLKVHQRCNLACDYCYVYEHADQSWRIRPRSMSDEVRDAALARIDDHVRRHGLKRFRVVLHGGEPLLYGAQKLSELADAVRAALPKTCAVEIAMQTNGVLLTEPVLATLAESGIRIGVSVDGVAAEHDRHRRLPDGRGSFRAVSEAIELLRRPEYRGSYAGLLCTVAAGTDPGACYEQLMAFEPPTVDLLLPHATWLRPPIRHTGGRTYGEWLIEVFDRWYADPPATKIRLFDAAIGLVLGRASTSEQIGLSPSGVVVIETDGEVEQVDALKVAYDGACATGLNVLRDDLDAALDDPGVVARQIGREALSDECLACPVVDLCGGGHYAHRYRAGAGFRNPSVYCADLEVFVRHVRSRVVTDLRGLAERRPTRRSTAGPPTPGARAVPAPQPARG